MPNNVVEDVFQRFWELHGAEAQRAQVNEAAQELRNIWEQAVPPVEPLKGKTGEELFQLILSSLREIYDIDAVIAGGAVRDLAAGSTDFKDVDVFLPINWETFYPSSSQLGWKEAMLLPKKKYKDCDVKHTQRAQTTVQGTTVDLVFMDEPGLTAENVDSFPIYAQRCIWTLGGGLELSPLAKNDIQNKQFTIDPTITDKTRLKNIYTKVSGWLGREHYKNWKIVEPDIKEWWEVKNEKPAKAPNRITKELNITGIQLAIQGNGEWEII